MRINQRGKAAARRRRGWQILEAPSGGDSGDKTPQDTTRSKGSPRRHRAWHILEAPTGEQPATSTDATHGPTLPDESTVHFVLSLALRIGEVQMASGAGASDVTATIISLASALGLPHCEVDVIYTSITVTCHRGTDVPPVTALRVVRSRGHDYSRLSEAERLVQQLTRGQLSVEQGYAELQRITRAKHPYPRWVSTLSWGGLAFFIALLIGATLDAAFVAFVISSIVDRIGRWLNYYTLPFFFQQVMGGLVATISAMAIVSSDLLSTDQPTLVVAAAITVLLSGLSTVSAVQDAITGYNVTAAGRTMETALMSAGLIAGVVLALQAAVLVGLSRTPLPNVVTTPQQLPVMLVAGAGAAACFALASYSKVRALLVASAAGAIGATVYGALRLALFDQISASAVAATVVGFCGGVLARRLKVTPLVVAVSGITPLLPGLATYRGLYQLGVEQSGNIATLMTAIAVGLALAAGVVLGEFLAQPVRTGLGRLERKLAGPRMAGPLNPGRRLE